MSRRQGIGFAVAQRLLADGLSVLIQSFAPHDADQPWAPAASELDAVIVELGGLSDRLDHIEAEFAAADTPRRVIDHAVDRFGGIDVLVVNHARSAMGRLDEVTAEELLAWAVNARATVLLVQAFAEHHDGSRPDGRVLLFTSGQHLEPMADELPHAISKGAVHQMTASLADALADRSHGQCDQPRPGRHGLAERGAERTPASGVPGRPLGRAARHREGRQLAGLPEQRLDHRPGHRRRRRLPTLR